MHKFKMFNRQFTVIFRQRSRVGGGDQVDDKLQIQSLLVTVTLWKDKTVTVTRLSLLPFLPL